MVTVGHSTFSGLVEYVELTWLPPWTWLIALPSTNAKPRLRRILLINFVFMLLNFLSFFGLPWLPSLGGHFSPFHCSFRRFCAALQRKWRQRCLSDHRLPRSANGCGRNRRLRRNEFLKM